MAAVGTRQGLALDRVLRLLRRVGVTALRELLDDLCVEGGQVVGLAARDEPGVDDDFLVDPVRTRVAKVGLQARPGRDRAALYDTGLDQRPRPVADDADRLAARREVADERDDVLVRPELVGVRHAAREDEPVVIRRLRLLDRLVDLEAAALVEVLPSLNLAVLDRDQLRLAAGLLDRLPRLGQLGLLDTLRRDEGDLLALQLVCHLNPFLRRTTGRAAALPRRKSSAAEWASTCGA